MARKQHKNSPLHFCRIRSLSLCCLQKIICNHASSSKSAAPCCANFLTNTDVIESPKIEPSVCRSYWSLWRNMIVTFMEINTAKDLPFETLAFPCARSCPIFLRAIGHLSFWFLKISEQFITRPDHEFHSQSAQFLWISQHKMCPLVWEARVSLHPVSVREVETS